MHRRQPPPLPSPRGGGVICSGLTVELGRGMDPRIKSGAGPVSRSLRSLGRGHDLLFVFLYNDVSPDDRGYQPRVIRGPCCTMPRNFVAVNKTFIWQSGTAETELQTQPWLIDAAWAPGLDPGSRRSCDLLVRNDGEYYCASSFLPRHPGQAPGGRATRGLAGAAECINVKVKLAAATESRVARFRIAQVSRPACPERRGVFFLRFYNPRHPGRAERYPGPAPAKAGVHAVREADVSLSLTGPPHATGNIPQASFNTTCYVLRTEYRGPCCRQSLRFVAIDRPTTSYKLRATGHVVTTHHVPLYSLNASTAP